MRYAWLSFVLFLPATTSLAQVSSGAAATVKAPVQEFPVVMQQKIQAGKTPVGTKVQAKLVIATLVNGVVFPRNAVFSGEVTESAAREGDTPSRLAVHMHALQWRDQSTNIETDLSAWIYPMAAAPPQDLSFHPPDEANSPKNWNGAGAYPDPNNPVSQKKFPGRDPDHDANPQASSPASQIGNHRVVMKGVIETYDEANRATLSSPKFNIVIDSTTTYVLTKPSRATK